MKHIIISFLLGAAMIGLSGCVTSEHKSTITTQESINTFQQVSNVIQESDLDNESLEEMVDTVGKSMDKVQEVFDEPNEERQPSKTQSGELKKP